MFHFKAKNIFIICAVLILAQFCISCKSQKEAVGPEDKIYVIADSSVYKKLKGSLEYAFEKTIFTPQPEKTFELILKDFKQLDEVKNFKNILLIAELNTNQKTADLISTILNEEEKEKASKGKQIYFIKQNLWLQNQLVMILTQPNLDSLEQNIYRNSEGLLKHFNKESGKRIFAALTSSNYERNDVEEKLYNDYKWKIFIPRNFDLALNIPSEKFVWLRSNAGEDFAKWIFVHWIDNASPELITPDSIIGIRNKLTEKYFRSTNKKAFVLINKNFRRTNEVNFNGSYALASQGLWEMSDKSKGGPFINYTIYDVKTKRIFMLDGSIYAPKYNKKELIQQLDVILQSFQTNLK
ncbi:MAG: DUF4837 family protein [Ignavibacteriales bacterium]|nr:DUF4837 family protein [Ignavibacteriales bacterium]